MGKLFVASVKMLYRDRQALFWALAFPVIFATVFALFDFDRPPEIEVAVVAEGASPLSEAMVAGLREVESFEVSTRASLAAARAELEDGDLDVVLAVPAAGPAPGRAGVRALYDETNFDTNQLALSSVERIVGEMNVRLVAEGPPPIVVAEEPVAARSVGYYDFLLPGLVAMGVMNFSIIGMAVAVSRYREQRILKRILATPLSPARFLASQVGARLVLALVQAAVILAVGVFVFGANVYGNVLWLFALATLVNLVFLNIGFAVAGRAPNADAAQGIGNAVALPMMFLAGVFFPTDTLPRAMQTVVEYLPLTPLIEALRKVALDAEPITATGPELALLGAWVVGSFLIASRLFRFARA